MPRARRWPPTRDQVETSRFGAATSGHVLLYGGDGRLRFSGGITGARGHEGSIVDRDRIEEVLRGRDAPAQSPIFGCAMFPHGLGPKVQ